MPPEANPVITHADAQTATCARDSHVSILFTILLHSPPSVIKEYKLYTVFLLNNRNKNKTANTVHATLEELAEPVVARDRIACRLDFRP